MQQVELPQMGQLMSWKGGCVSTIDHYCEHIVPSAVPGLYGCLLQRYPLTMQKHRELGADGRMDGNGWLVKMPESEKNGRWLKAQYNKIPSAS